MFTFTLNCHLGTFTFTFTFIRHLGKTHNHRCHLGKTHNQVLWLARTAVSPGLPPSCPLGVLNRYAAAPFDGVPFYRGHMHSNV